MRQQRVLLPPLPLNPTLPPKPDFASFSFNGGVARQSKPSKLLSRMEQASLPIASTTLLDSAVSISQPDTTNISLVPSNQSSFEPPSSAPTLAPDQKAAATASDEGMEDHTLPLGTEQIQDIPPLDTSRSQEPSNGHSLDNWIRTVALLGSGDIELHVKQVTDEWAQVARVPLQTYFTPAPPQSEPTFSSPMKQEPVSPPSTVELSISASSFSPEKILSNEPPLQPAGPAEVVASGPPFDIAGQEDTFMTDAPLQSSNSMDSCQLLAVPQGRPGDGSKSNAETPIQTGEDVASTRNNALDRATIILQVPVSTGPTLNAQPTPHKSMPSVDTGKARYNTHRDPSHEALPPSASTVNPRRASVVNGSRRLTPPLRSPLPPQSQGRTSRGYQSYTRSASPIPRNSRPPVRGQAFSPSRSPIRLRSSSPAPRGAHQSRYTPPKPQSRSRSPARRLRDSPPHLHRTRRPSSAFRHLSPPPTRHGEYAHEPYYSLPPPRNYGYADSYYPEVPLPSLYERSRSPARDSLREPSRLSIGHPEQTFTDFHSRNEEIRSDNRNSSRDMHMASYTRPEKLTQSVSYKRARDDDESALGNRIEPVPKRQRVEQGTLDEAMSTLFTGRPSHVPMNSSQSHSRSISPQNPTSEKKGKLWNIFAGGSIKPSEPVEPNTAGPSTRHLDGHTESAPPLQQRIQATSQRPVAQIPKAGLAKRLGGVQTEANVQSTNISSSTPSPLARRINGNQNSPVPAPSTRRRAESRQETLAQRMSLEQPSGSNTLISRLVDS